VGKKLLERGHIKGQGRDGWIILNTIKIKYFIFGKYVVKIWQVLIFFYLYPDYEL
jgi:hypothetical protein